MELLIYYFIVKEFPERMVKAVAQRRSSTPPSPISSEDTKEESLFYIDVLEIMPSLSALFLNLHIVLWKVT